MTIKILDNSPSQEQGSIFFYIMLGVVLFGALAFVMSRGIRSQSTDALSKRQIEIAASELLGNAQILSRGIDKMRQNNVSESDFCFTSESISEKNNKAYGAITGCAIDTNRLYHPEGGSVSYFSIPDDWLDSAHKNDQGYGEWMFTNENAVDGLGEGEYNQPSSVELIAHINHLKEKVCAQVNKELGIDGIPDNSGDFEATAPFTGPFAANGTIHTPELKGKRMGCFKTSSPWNSYIFYTVLVERD